MTSVTMSVPPCFICDIAERLLLWYSWGMKKKVTHQVLEYTAVFEPDEEVGGFTVTIPSLPGCISEGDTFEKALENIKEAATLYVETLRDERREVSQSRGVVIAPVYITI